MNRIPLQVMDIIIVKMIKKLFKNIWNAADAYFSKDDKAVISHKQSIIKDLRSDVKVKKEIIGTFDTLNKKNAELVATLRKQRDILLRKYDVLKAEKERHKSLNNYITWLRNEVKPAVKYHKTQLGKIRPHTSLARVDDVDKVLTFAEKIVGRTSFNSEDDLVFYFNNSFQNKYPTNKWYKSDIEVWRKSEYWETPDEVIDLIKNKKTFADCDSVSFLKYWCLRLLLDKYFPNWERRRLAVFLVDINIIGGGHALLAWIKEGPNDWIPIESTYFNKNFSTVWNKNYTFRGNNIAYDIWYSFDTDEEYERI